MEFEDFKIGDWFSIPSLPKFVFIKTNLNVLSICLTPYNLYGPPFRFLDSNQKIFHQNNLQFFTGGISGKIVNDNCTKSEDFCAYRIVKIYHEKKAYYGLHSNLDGDFLILAGDNAGYSFKSTYMDYIRLADEDIYFSEIGEIKI